MEVSNRVIVFGGGLVNTLGLVRSIGRMGKKVDLIVPKPELAKGALASSRYVNRVIALKDRTEAVDVLVREYRDEPVKPVILCECDALMSVIDARLDELLPHFYVFNANREAGRINFFLNKMNQFPLAEECGLALVPTWQVSSGDPIPRNIVYPCLTKGENSTGSTKGDMHICKTEEELRAAFRTGSDYIVQKFIEKEYELDVVGFAYNNGKDVIIPAVVRKIRDGLYRQSDCIRLESVCEYPNLDVDAIRRLVARIGYEGIFSVEFMYASGRYYFLEINLRNDGTSYLYTLAGVNYPWLWVLYNSGNLDETLVRSLNPRTPRNLVQVYDFFNVLEKKLSFGGWLKSLWESDGWFVFDLKDMKPFLISSCELMAHAVNKCGRMLKRRRNG